MISKNRIKYIHSLELKKKRNEEGLFVAEGPKLVEELLGTFHCVFLAATPAWWMRRLPENPVNRLKEVTELPPSLRSLADEVALVDAGELSRASLQPHPQEVLALFRQPGQEADCTMPARSLCLALDNVQDPGNLGTIIRLADWFGISQVYCSPGTVDVYNPKVVQATMGALARVKVYYLPLEVLIRAMGTDVPVYGAFLDGDNLYDVPLTAHGLLIMGNEGKGITPEIADWVTHRLYIPNYPPGNASSESLNVAIATAIVCAEFRRRG